MGKESKVSTRLPGKRVTWGRTFGFALAGIVHATAHERNMWIHLSTGFLALVFCLFTRPPIAIVASVCTISCLVLAAEVFNTAIEALTDLATQGQPHPLAKVAKDAAAGSVLLTSMAALCVGAWLVIAEYPWHFRLFTTWHAGGAFLAVMGILVMATVAARASRHRKDAETNSPWSAGRRRRPE